MSFPNWDNAVLWCCVSLGPCVCGHLRRRLFPKKKCSSTPDGRRCAHRTRKRVRSSVQFMVSSAPRGHGSALWECPVLYRSDVLGSFRMLPGWTGWVPGTSKYLPRYASLHMSRDP